MACSSVLVKALAAETAAFAAAEAMAEPGALRDAEVLQIFEAMDRVARAAGTAKLLLGTRLEQSGAAQRRGKASTADLLAEISGTSVGQARSDLEASKALEGLDETRAALLRGTVSPEQGKVIAGAAKDNPHSQGRLLGAATTRSHKELQDEAKRVRAEGDEDPEATLRRIHAKRSVSMWTDAEGVWHLKAQGTGVDGAILQKAIERGADRHFREHATASHHEPRGAYAFDALKDLVTAKALLGEAVLKLVLTDGFDVLNVTSLTRGPRQAMRYATLWTSPTCTVAGCDRTICEHDHTTGKEWKDTRHTRFDELDHVCTVHHDLHTRDGWALVTGKGKRPMVPPGHPDHPTRPGTAHERPLLSLTREELSEIGRRSRLARDGGGREPPDGHAADDDA